MHVLNTVYIAGGARQSFTVKTKAIHVMDLRRMECQEANMLLCEFS